MLPAQWKNVLLLTKPRGYNVQESIPAQSAKNNLFPVIDTGRQKIHDERSFEAAWHLKTFFCRAGIYGKNF